MATSELMRRLARLSRAIADVEKAASQSVVFEGPSVRRLRRLFEEVRLWAEHVEEAAPQGAVPELTEDGGVMYKRA